jgi:hypothetical protein
MSRSMTKISISCFLEQRMEVWRRSNPYEWVLKVGSTLVIDFQCTQGKVGSCGEESLKITVLKEQRSNLLDDAPDNDGSDEWKAVIYGPQRAINGPINGIQSARSRGVIQFVTMRSKIGPTAVLAHRSKD